MRWLFRATDESFRKAIRNERNEGRVPMARLIYGYVSGHGWGFLRPWEQQALFPEKGTVGGVGHPDRHHQRFWILRLKPTQRRLRHRNHDYFIEGRYWHALVWRSGWGYRWRYLWRWRRAIVDPDMVTDDPGKAEDWREYPQP